MDALGGRDLRLERTHWVSARAPHRKKRRRRFAVSSAAPLARRAKCRGIPTRGTIDADALEGVDAVINLAGENLAQRWTDDVKRRIRDSRVQGTTLLAKTLATLVGKPRVFLSGSAIGVYGDRGDEVLDEIERARRRLSRVGLQGVGGGDGARGRRGNSRRESAHRDSCCRATAARSRRCCFRFASASAARSGRAASG